MRTKTYKTVQGIASQTIQLTAQEVINNRFHHNNHSWINFKLDDKAMDQFFTDMVAIMGGRNKLAIRRALRRSPIHWALERITYNKKHGWNYCAGQDYNWELNILRKYLYNL